METIGDSVATNVDDSPPSPEGELMETFESTRPELTSRSPPSPEGELMETLAGG